MRVRRRNRAGTAVERARQRGARRVAQRRQYDLARSGEHPRSGMARGRWDRPGLRYEPVDGDAELVPGVELVETGGHVPGHQSVLVRLPETGPVLLVIDAMPAADALDPDARDHPLRHGCRGPPAHRARPRRRAVAASPAAAPLLLVTPEGTPKRGGRRL